MNHLPTGELKHFDLQHKYAEERGEVYLSGMQALVRVLLDQKRSDRRNGLATAGFVSGYPGSPVGGLDHELTRNSGLLHDHDVVFQPGQNEELAATAVFGTQMLNEVPGARYDGVFGMWYGKAPGVERAGDAFHHHNFRGVHRHGGVLAVAGDDPQARSTIFPSDSNAAFYKFFMPILAPGHIQDILDLGLHGYALSRAAGLWIGFKLVTDVADSAGRAMVGPDRIMPVVPELNHGGRRFDPHLRVNEAGAALVEAEREILHERLELARRYAALNSINIVAVAPLRPRIGIVAAGKTYFEVRQALLELGLDEAGLAARGVAILRIRMVYPLEAEIVRSFARGLEEIIVVEDKRPFLELFVKDMLYASGHRPIVVGKTDETGRPLLPSHGELSATQIALALAQRFIGRVDLPECAESALFTGPQVPSQVAPSTNRTAYFCSGCPHNRSLQAPEGAIVGAGIGCHIMNLWMGEGFGEVKGYTQMGGEGAQWIGLSRFTTTPHMIQNLGDGTFAHSGSLAIRFAIAAGVNITYKILYNSTVAMTGGQDVQGGMTVEAMVRMLEAEGASRIIITTEEPGRYPAGTVSGAQVWHRDRLIEAQLALARHPGVTILLHDQECATQKRRLRKRGRLAFSREFTFINERVCEGCGDCGRKSNCLSVQPVATAFGRKTQIDQSSCNQDFSCLLGDCPSFLTVEGATSGPKGELPAFLLDNPAIPMPAAPFSAGTFSACLMGIGGTGVITINQILGTAAFLAGLCVRTYDHTGSSQKAGPVVSHLKIFPPEEEGSPLVGPGSADLYLVFDPIVGATPANLALAAPGKTIAIVSTAEVPTGEMVADKTKRFPSARLLRQAIDAVSTPERNVFLDAMAEAGASLGDQLASNMLLVGAAYQSGALPIAPALIEDAIRLNGVAVDLNIAAFRQGRLMIAEPPKAACAPAPPSGGIVAWIPANLEARIGAIAGSDALRSLLEIRVADLIAYQDVEYSIAFLAFVERVAAAERALDPTRSEITAEAARSLHKLMAYKDEYEVARLLLDQSENEKLRSVFGRDAKVSWNLHPSILRSLGVKKKVRLGPWFRHALVALRFARRARGTPLDFFGRASIRRCERSLIHEYKAMMDKACAGLNESNYDKLLKLAQLPDMIRGYENVKLGNIAQFREQAGLLLHDLGVGQPASVPGPA